MEIIKRLPQESIKEYTTRLCENRDSYGLSWDGIAELVNAETGDNFSGDKYRKWYNPYSEGFSDGRRASLSTDDSIREYETKKIELQKMKIQISDQRREFANVLRNSSRFDAIKEELVDSIKELANAKPLEWKPVDVVMYDHMNREAVLVLSDWHKGTTANNYWNKFDNDEFYRRVERLLRKTIEYCKENCIRTVHVFIQGDMVSGIIHTTTRIWNMENVIKQTQSVSEILAECIVKLANEFPEVVVYNVRGNHDRVIPNKGDELNSESFSDFIPWFLKARLSHIDNVRFAENAYDDEIIVANVAGYKVVGVHGHKDKPDNVIQNLSLMLKLIPDYVVFGHYHHSASGEAHGVEWIQNGTLSGTDEYAVNIRKTSKPSQSLIIFDPQEGRLCTYNIRLDIAS